MTTPIELLEEIAKAINYVTDHPTKLGTIILIGAAVGIYLCSKGKSGKAATTIAMMVIVGLTFLLR